MSLEGIVETAIITECVELVIEREKEKKYYFQLISSY